MTLDLSTNGRTGSSVDQSAASTTSILMVDDRPENLLALEAALAPLQQNLIRASSGDEALRCLLKKDVAVIILDVQMPGLDGFETAGYIKQLDRTRHIPIIFLTAINKEARHVFRGYSAGAVDYLFKPFDPVVLRSKVSVFIDLHEKKNQLQASEERFRRAFEHAPAGIALVDLDGSILKVNNALEELTGFSAGQLATKALQQLIHPDEVPLDLRALTVDPSTAAATSHVERRLATRDGRERHALISVSFVHGVRGLGPHYVLQLTDITERRELEAFRERFVSHAAHELRTPATVIAGTASLLHDNRAAMGAGDVDQCITALYRQSQRLTAMVSNLLDLARLKEGRLRSDLQPVELPAVTEQLVKNHPPPEDKLLHVDVPDDVVALVDPDGVDHILSNLLINAYRYGGRNVNLDARRDGDSVLVTFTDDGPGVPSELLPRLFQPFARGKLSSSVGGSGLGLALVKSLAEASGGEVTYESAPGGGACFTVRLLVGP